MTGEFELILLFCAIFGAAFLTLQWLQGRDAALQARQQSAREEDAEGADPKPLFGSMTPALAAQVPLSAEAEEAMRPELREAGYYAPTALEQYAALRSLLTILPLLVALVAALLVPRTLIPGVFVAGVVIAALGFSLPRVVVNQIAKSRKRQIERGLPVAVDLLALSMTAGQTLLSSLERVGAEIRFSFPVLARELDIVRHHARLRSLDFALRDWADRVRIPEVRQLVAILTSADRLGRDICSGLLEFADHYRTTQRQRADAQASRASVLMLFPMLLGLWLPAATILVAPILFQFHQRGAEGMEAVKKSNTQREEMERRLKRIQSPNKAPDSTPSATTAEE